MGLIEDLRLDIADDSSVSWPTAPTGIITPSPVVGNRAIGLIEDVRLDIGDDDSVVWPPHPTGIIPESQVWNSVTVNNNYVGVPNDTVILVNPVPLQSVTITLPPVTQVGKIVVIKDMPGIAATFPINISGGPATIDGFASVLMSQDYQAFSFFWNGTEWNII